MNQTDIILPWWPVLAISLIGFVVGFLLLIVVHWMAGILAILPFGIAVPSIYLMARRQLSIGASENCLKAKADLQTAQQQLDESRTKWTEWLLAAGLRPDVTPEGALEMVGMINECRTRVKAAENQQERVDSVVSYIREYRQKVAIVAEGCGQALSHTDDVGAVADRLAEQLQGVQEEMRRRTALGSDITDLQLGLEELEEKRQELDKDLGEILALGKAASAQEFRDRAAIWTRREELERDIRQFNMALERIAGQGERVEALKTDLGRMAPDAQELLKHELEKKLPEKSAILKNTYDERGTIRQQLTDLESEDNAGELRMREQSLLAELQQAARKWAVLTITRAILTEAKERYERERQPGVIRDASNFFERITRKQYAQVLASPEESTLNVLDGHGYRKQMRDLSRGTQEQLYLAVRLGLIREFSQRQESLPVLMDDVLVNFDPRRAEASLDALLELASTHQVLLFTCHPETCDLVRRLAPETPIFELVNGELRL